MTFLNGLLALGALAFSIPLIIHLFYKSRFRTVQWGAWHLLDSVIRVNRRRMQLTNLLLLLLRCAIPILLAFCLARPVLTQWRQLPGDAPQPWVIAFDDSRSMQAAIAGQSNRLEQAKIELTEMLKGMTRRDEIMLIPASRVDAPPATMGVADALERVRDMQANGGPVELSRLVGAALDSATQASHSQRRILVVSDFQSENVGTASVNSLDNLAEQIAQQDPKPVVSFLNFGRDTDSLMNLSVDRVSIDSPALVAGRSAQFSAKIHNASDNPARELRVVWSIDSVPLAPRLATVDERSSTTARLSHRFDEPGVHEVTVSVEHGDSLADDNRRSIAVDVMREIKVLLVDGKPSNQPLQGQADFLSIALSPFAFGGDDQPDSVKATVTTTGTLRKELNETKPEIVILANVRSLDGNEKKDIANFVLRGGSLVLFDGDQVDPQMYNESFSGDDGPLEFPAIMGTIAGDPEKKNETSFRIGDLNPQYSPWALLAPGDQRPLGEVEVYAYRNLKISDPKVDEQGNPIADENGSAILLRMSDGSPIVVAAKRGRGQVVQFALPCNASWSSLPLRLVYLPMMQQMVLDLAGRRRSSTLNVGEPISIPLAEFPVAVDKDGKLLPVESTNTQFTIQTPSESEVAIEPSSVAGQDQSRVAELNWTSTHKPGTYQFRRSIEYAVKDSREKQKLIAKTLRVVEVPASESILRDTDTDRLANIASKLDAKIYTDLGTLQSDDRTRRFGREIWRWLLYALLVAMIAELFLQQRLVRTTPTGGAK